MDVLLPIAQVVAFLPLRSLPFITRPQGRDTRRTAAGRYIGQGLSREGRLDADRLAPADEQGRGRQTRLAADEERARRGAQRGLQRVERRLAVPVQRHRDGG